MDYNIGTAYGRIVVNASDLGRATSALDLLSKRFLVVGGLAAAGLGLAIKSAADFETQMSRFGAVSGATEGQLDKIRVAAKKLGVDAGIGATEVAKGFVEIAKAGLPVQDVLAGVGRAAVSLAAAGELDMATATEVLVNTMRIFNLKGKDAVDVANLLAGAANASTLEVDDLAVSLRYVGPVAATAGISLKSTAEALAILGNAGIKGSTAGTSLRGILVSLTPSSEKAAEAMRQLGIITEDGSNRFFTAEGKVRSFAEIAEVLKGAMGGVADKMFDAEGNVKSYQEIQDLLNDSTVSLTDKQRIEALVSIFQRRAMASAAVMARGGAKDFDKLRKSNQFSAEAQDIMREKLDNVNGSLRKLRAATQNFLITMGTIFQPIIKAAADALANIAKWLDNLSPGWQKVIAGMLTFIAVGGLTGGILLRIASRIIQNYRAVKDLKGAFRILGALMPRLAKALNIVRIALVKVAVAAAANPYVLIALAVIALIAGFALLVAKWQEVEAWIKKHKKWAALILLLLGPMALVVVATLALAKAVRFLINNWHRLDEVWATLLARIKALPGKIWEFIQGVPGQLLEWGKSAITKIWEGMQAAWPYIATFLSELPGKILEFFVTVASWLLDVGWQLLSGLLTGTINFLPELAAWWLDLQFKILGWIGDAAVWLIGKGVDIVVGLIQGVNRLMGDFANMFLGLGSKVVGWIGDTGSWLISAGKNLLEGLLEGMKSAWEKVKDFAGGIKDAIVSLKGPPNDDRKALVKNGQLLMEGLGKGLAMGWADVEKQLAGYTAMIGGRSGATDLSMGAVAARGGGLGAAANRGRTVPAAGRQVIQYITIDALDARQASLEIEKQRVWAEMNSGL